MRPSASSWSMPAGSLDRWPGSLLAAAEYRRSWETHVHRTGLAG